MLLVSSVKTTDFMDRRGFVAILSVLHSKMLNSQLTSRLILEFLTISQSTFKQCNLELGGTRIKLVISRGSKILRGESGWEFQFTSVLYYIHAISDSVVGDTKVQLYF